MSLFSHRHRTGRRHNCISYLLTRAKDDSQNIHRTQALKAPPGSHEMGPSAAAARCLQRPHTILITFCGVLLAARQSWSKLPAFLVSSSQYIWIPLQDKLHWSNTGIFHFLTKQSKPGDVGSAKRVLPL